MTLLCVLKFLTFWTGSSIKTKTKISVILVYIVIAFTIRIRSRQKTKPKIRKTAVQALGSEELTPPYLAPTTRGSLILNGVNYASGGSGILNSTGKLFVRISLIIY